MITKDINVCQLGRDPLIIGRQMEDNYRQFVFDCSGFGEAENVTLVHKRSKDAAPYIVTTADGSVLTWTITDTDTAYFGDGNAEIRINFADGLAKTATFATYVIKSITADTTIPEPLQSWYDAMIDYINEHSITDDQLSQAIEDYIEEHPITAPVTSVNTKTGDVVLTASDVGAYTKPSGGIPKTDLAASVQASLNKADTALQSAPVTSVNSKTGAVSLNASDVGAMPSTYTAPVTSVDGKTGAVQIMPSGGTTGQVLTKTATGTAWQTVSGGGAVDSVNGQTGVVVLDASDVGALPDDTAIPTKTSDLTNDSGFLSTAVTSFNGSTGAVTYTAPVTSVNGSTGAVVIANATTSAAGLMSATDKSHLDDVYADYSSALTALGVI